MKTINEIVQEISAEYAPLIDNCETYQTMRLNLEMAVADGIRMALQQHTTSAANNIIRHNQ